MATNCLVCLVKPAWQCATTWCRYKVCIECVRAYREKEGWYAIAADPGRGLGTMPCPGCGNVVHPWKVL